MQYNGYFVNCVLTSLVVYCYYQLEEGMCYNAKQIRGTVKRRKDE